MKKIIPVLLLVLLVAAGVWLIQSYAKDRLDSSIKQFHRDSDSLIRGLQQYKEFVGNYPQGDLIAINKALSGQGKESKAIILAGGNDRKNSKGEIVDPWGTPLQFYFSHNAVMIRSAGPNKLFEDSLVFGSDDLIRTDVEK